MSRPVGIDHTAGFLSATEEWRQVPGFEGYYEVSSLGRVKSVGRVVMMGNGVRKTIKELILTPTPAACYLAVALWRDNKIKTCKIHTLVALAFIGPRPGGMEVAHWNGDGRDNRVNNLRYATPAQNTLDKLRHDTIARGENVGGARLTPEIVRAIRQRVSAGELQYRLAEEFGVSKQTVNLLVNGKTWRHVA